MQVILAFWLALAYDRRTIDVIITNFFPLCFKMAESFENLNNILYVTPGSIVHWIWQIAPVMTEKSLVFRSR